nr:putative reverse transcriptase domain-containing protein [Tanacetum cinerariifolium]
VRNRESVTLTKETIPVYDTEIDQPAAEPAEVIYPDRGERTLRASPAARTGDDTLWLRTNIFCTRCTAKGEVCTIIIDGGSCENMVATTMVEKLGLTPEPRPDPYQLTWLKKGNMVKVNQRCLFKFSIGNRYSDEIWCEVIYMDACHILLGLPWQYDQKTKHDGFNNMYSFKNDGVNITLAPLDTRATMTEALVLNKSAFMNFTRATKPPFVFALVIAEVNPAAQTPPSEIKPLLKEFVDVFPSEIPAGLPLVQEIQHCIDFLPGAVIPNKPAYRMNPKEYEELHRQVNELLEKGLIKKSMSPCVVPALLVPKANGTYRICVDSRSVNKITIKYRFPIPRFEDLLDQLHGAQIFYKIDLQSGYHQIRMRPGDEWKTAFKTRDGHFEWMVMPFGVSNAPKVLFLGYHVSDNEIRMDEMKVDAILTWPVPTNIHEALRFIQGQHKLCARHAKWVEFLQDYSFVIRHKSGTANTVADALSRRRTLLTSLQVKVEWFDTLCTLYPADLDFSAVWEAYRIAPTLGYSIVNGFLFKRVRLCIPKCSFKDAILFEGHKGAPIHPLPVPDGPWEDVSLNFLVGLLKTQRQKDSVMIVVDRFSKMAHFIACAKTYDARQIANLYFQEIVRLHGIPKTLTSDRDDKFIGHFWRTLWKKLGSRLNLSSAHHPQSDGQTEVTNGSLGNLLRCLVGNNQKQWDLVFPQVEFAYNRSYHRSTGMSLFLIVYGRNPFTPLDLASLPAIEHYNADGEAHANQVKIIHEQVRGKITNNNIVYQRRANSKRKRVVFKESELVWIHLSKERFLRGRASKLQPHADGPFKVLERISDNAYKLDFPGHYNVSATFNVADLSPFVPSFDDPFDSGTSSFEDGGDDATSGSDPAHLPDLSAQVPSPDDVPGS